MSPPFCWQKTLTCDSLASRQRKKKHTEDLEGKVGDLNEVIATLESQLHDSLSHLETEKTKRRFFECRLQEADVTINGLRQEKEHMVVQHTHVTSKLRQHISILEDPIASPAPAMSMAPSSTGYTDINSDLDQFNLNTADWENQFNMHNGENDWNLTTSSQQSEATIQPSKLLSPLPRQDQTKKIESENIPTGVLFMLLLCGAFVAANSASAKAPVIPRMPDDVRAVSDTVLNSLLQDTNIDPALSGITNQYNMDFTDPSMQNWPSNVPDTSTLGNMHRHLTSPSRRQLAEQASMLTPEQYNSLTNPTHVGQNMALPNRQKPTKRNLADILSNMRQENIAKGSTSEVYTRSILWNQVPDDVVKQFKQAVRDSETSIGSASGSGIGPDAPNNKDYKARS